MKALIYLAVFLAAITASFSQPNKPLLTTDIIFDQAALKNLRFPTKAFNQAKSVRVYVRFTLTPEGEYRDIAIVNSKPVDESFHEELNRFWSRLPNQASKYAGYYVVPISFLFGDRGPEKLKPISNETDTVAAQPGYTLLSGLPIISYVLCEKKAFVE
ncbi:hypothetical protein WBJ53_17685 [Spirosoma sp. SC4-14]|uniref:hypothetical protein n=1 Tax=Spirosoma sp. SC4-14 TaxID=3128900 RepID=UPI0030D4CCB5